MKAVIVSKGGPGSGHHGHAGRLGKVGGSLPGGGGGFHDILFEDYKLLEKHYRELFSGSGKLHEYSGSINSYSSSGYRRINGYLRSKMEDVTFVERTKKQILDIDCAIKESTGLPQDLKLYRGIVSEDLHNMFRDEYNVGDMITDLGYSSTTFDKHVISRYMETSGYSISLIINARKGSKGVLAASASDHPEEKEWIFPRGSMFRVNGIIVGDTENNLEIDVEYLGDIIQ